MAAAIVAILGYFGIKPSRGNGTQKTEISNSDQAETEMDLQFTQNFDVRSYNQQGGVTAGQININRPPRTLSPQLKAQLDELLPAHKDKEIKIDAQMGDSEAFQFAQEIKDYLEYNGWKVNGVNQVIWDKPVMGQIIMPDRTNIRISGRK